MRVSVIGNTGSGKSTFAHTLAKACAISAIELDEINIRAHWYQRYVHEFDNFKTDVEKAIQGEHWVIAGGYTRVQSLIFGRATHVLWLDLPRHIVMRQVIYRSIKNAISGTELFDGCTEEWHRLLRKDHPIRLAWDTHALRREKLAALLEAPDAAHLTLLRCSTRPEVHRALDQLITLHHAK